MHELAVCQALLAQVARVALDNRAGAVTRIRVGNGPLSGVDSHLLERAFEVARAGTMAAGATLILEEEAVRVRCNGCGAESAVAANRLVCPACGQWRTEVIAGDGLTLLALELALE